MRPDVVDLANDPIADPGDQLLPPGSTRSIGDEEDTPGREAIELVREPFECAFAEDDPPREARRR